MNDEQVFELAEKSSFQDDSGCWIFKDEGLLDFVFMVKKAERERVAKWMMEQGYATGHGDTIEELLKELEWQVAERERAACAKLCDEQSDKDGFEGGYANECAELIRARGIDGATVGEVGVWGDTAPPKKEWVGLTDEDLEPMCDDWRIIFGPYVHDFSKAIETKLKEKNGG